MAKIRVLVVDDSAFFRRRLSEALGAEAAIEVVGTASHGRTALARIPQVNPDLVTLDVEMPEMDGLQTLTALRADYPRLPVVMVSAQTRQAAAVTIDALLRGASDYVTKPTAAEAGGLERLGRELVAKVLRLAVRDAPPRRPLEDRGDRARGTVGLLAIGASTGGPNALHEIFASLPAGLPVPIAVVQHMPPLFTRSLAERLGQTSRLQVHEAEEGMVLHPGHAYIAPGDWHMQLVARGDEVRVRLDREPPENSVRPAVDPLFRSAAQAYGPGVLGVVLTGMGQDGLRGATLVREAGGEVWAQDEASSVVWGMPGFVARAGLASRILPLGRIGHEVGRRVLQERD